MPAQKEFDALEIISSISFESERDVIKAALATLSAVVVATPVGNPTLWQNPAGAPPGYVGGHARRNWQVTLRAPLSGTGAKGIPGRGKGEAGATNEAVGIGGRRIKNFKIADARIIIQNQVPYIVPLNNGHSAQAPANFVQSAVMAGTNVGRNDRKELP